jgi:prepilin-type N-terminal cleavage/methylation domain-containing protein
LRSTPDIRRRLGASDGFTLIELLVALIVLAVGILSTFFVFDSSNRASSVSEAQQAEIHRAQSEIERLQSLPYDKLGLTATPATSANVNNPGYYVKGGPCPVIATFKWNQSTGATNAPDQLVVNGCSYEYEEKPGVKVSQTFATGGVVPTSTWSDGRLSGTVYDYITWVKDANCNAGKGCPTVNDYKRITVEVTNNTNSAASAPTAPVLVSAVVANPSALPIAGKPNTGDPLNEVKCTNGEGQTVTCNYGLGNETPNTWYLTDSPEETGYKEPKANDSCMHYTQALKPTLCGGTPVLCTTTSSTECPRPDLLEAATPPAAKTEYNFSPNIEVAAGVLWTGEGRVILRDPKATPPAEACAKPPSEDARTGELWATRPLTAPLQLSGNGGMTLYTRTLSAVATNVTLCVGVFLENPVSGKPEGFLDPLNRLGTGTDSEQLGVVSLTLSQWPAEVTPVSFTFNYMSTSREAAKGVSLAVRIWAAAGSGDNIVAQYDAELARSSVQINSK